MNVAQKPEITTQQAARVIGGSPSKRRVMRGRETITTVEVGSCVLRHTRLRECAQDEAPFSMPSTNFPHPQRAPTVAGRSAHHRSAAKHQTLSCGKSL